MHKEDLAPNNLQWLICHKAKPNHPNTELAAKLFTNNLIKVYFSFFFSNSFYFFPSQMDSMLSC